jgi:DNA-binding Lrp family transcriptional regulator
VVVSYSGKGGPTQRYVCRGASNDIAASCCISFGGVRVDRAVAQEVLDRLQPLGIEAALGAMNAHGEGRLEKRRQLANALEQARFEAARAHRQYDQVDPDNRLVASELERRWNERLASVHALEEQVTQHDTGPAIALGLEDRERLLALGRDLSRAWASAAASIETRKKIVRLLIVEIIVDVESDKLELVIHWHGGYHTRLSSKRNKVGQNHWAIDADVVDLVRIGLSASPCWRRIKQLEKEGFIRGRVALLDRKKLNVGVTVFVAGRTNQHSTDWFKRFAKTVSDIPEVVEFYRMSGHNDYLMKIVIPDIAAYDAVYKRLIDKLPMYDVTSMFAMEQIKSTTEIPLKYAT